MCLAESILDRAGAGSERLPCAAGISRQAGLGGAMLVADPGYFFWDVSTVHVRLEKLAAQEIRRHNRAWVHIRPTARITYPWKFSIGDYSWVGDGAVIYTLERIEVGRNVSVSQRCYLCAGSHDYTQRDFATSWIRKGRG